MENLNQFLQKLKIEIDKIPPTKTEFNVFTALNLETDEVYCHSQLITEFLNPQGRHGKGDVFLKLFLQQIGFEKSHSANVCVLKENKKIDIQIIDNDWIILIENKINHHDTDDQIKGYYDKIKKVYANSKQIYILYLDRFGSEPDRNSRRDIPIAENGMEQDKIFPISYKDTIKTWLENCLKETATEPFLRETIAQYLFIIKKITGQVENKQISSGIEQLLKSHKIYETVNSTDWSASYASLKYHTQLQMWTMLEKASNNKIKDLEPVIVASNLTNTVSSFPKKNKNYYGLVWKIKDIIIPDMPYSFGFKIEINGITDDDDLGVYMGIRLLKNDKEEVEDVNDSIFQQYRDFDNFEIKDTIYEFLKEEGSSWWLNTYTIQKNGTNLDFTNFNTEAIYSIVQDDDCKVFAAEVAEAARSIITQFKDNIEKSSKS
jgi:PD-(D/E)XK nuclease superfamily